MAYKAALLALVATLAACSIRTANAITADELTFPQIAATRVNGQNATGQWALTIERGNKAGSFMRVNCSSPVYGACLTETYTPVMQDVGDLIRVNYTFNPNFTTIVTHKNATPTDIQVRLCYSAYSFVDRAWRKKNKPYPRLSQNCPRKGPKVPINLTTDSIAASNTGSYTFDFDELDEIPTATWFTMTWVYCGDVVCAFDTTENRNFVETKVEMGVTAGMRAAAIVLSIFGPVFFVGFYILDNMYYKKHGRGIGWA